MEHLWNQIKNWSQRDFHKAHH